MSNLTEQEKLDRIAGSMLATLKSKKAPSKPTKKDLDRKFRIVFDSEGEPVFEEIMEKD